MANPIEQFEAGIFFDNEQRNIVNDIPNPITRKVEPTGVCDLCSPGILCVKINESDPSKPLPNMTWKNPILSKYITDNNLTNNSYYNFIKNIIPDEIYDKESGIQKEHIDIFNKWIDDTNILNITKRVAIFDWDRTISMMEGGALITPKCTAVTIEGTVRTPGNLGTPGLKESLLRQMPSKYDALKDYPNITAEDMLLYLCGGETRLKMLRDLFNSCVDKHIYIIIITNNAAAQKNAFTDMIKHLLITDPQNYKIIYSRNPAMRYTGKGNFLKYDASGKFEKICTKDPHVVPGGNRKINKKNNKTHNKKSNKTHNKKSKKSRKK